MNYNTITSIFLTLSLFITACNVKEQKTQDESSMIAGLEKEYLEKAEYLKLFKSAYSGRDSIALAKRIIENWATETLVYKEASQNLGSEEIKINKLVDDYRKNLINHMYISKIVEVNLDTNISEQEIVEYYNVNRDNFILKDNIVKVDYLKIPIQSPDLEKIKKLLKSQVPKEKAVLMELCSKNAENYFLNDSTWLYTSDVRKEIPKLYEEPDFSFYTGKVVVFEDEFYFYYLKIKDVKIKNGFSPLNFERENIKQYILLNRKKLLINSFQQNLLEEAKTTNKLRVL